MALSEAEPRPYPETPIFKPGDLIHGAFLSQMLPILQSGIKIQRGYGTFLASFAMFPDHEDPEFRYKYGSHKGPETGKLTEGTRMGFIVEREKLLKALRPEQVYAVGYNFYEKSGTPEYDEVHRLYPFSPDGRRVFGIQLVGADVPQSRVNPISSWRSEVRVYKPHPEEENRDYSIPPSVISGIVVGENAWDANTSLSRGLFLQRRLIEVFHDADHVPPVYVLSPDGKVLCPNLRDLVKRAS